MSLSSANARALEASITTVPFLSYMYIYLKGFLQVTAGFAAILLQPAGGPVSLDFTARSANRLTNVFNCVHWRKKGVCATGLCHRRRNIHANSSLSPWQFDKVIFFFSSLLFSPFISSSLIYVFNHLFFFFQYSLNWKKKLNHTLNRSDPNEQLVNLI